MGLPVEAHSFDEFYRTQVDAIYRALTLALADEHLAREAVDEAMTRAYARWATVARYDNPGGWVFRVGLNWATSWWRTRRLERPLLDERADALARRPDTLEDGSYADSISIHRVLARLSVNHRAVIVCRILLDLSVAETATVLNITEGTVKSRLARALAVLRTAVSKESTR